MMKSLQKYWLGVIIIVILALDQLSKYIIKTTMFEGQSISVIGNFFRITYVENPGMAFGIRLNSPVLFLSLSVIAAILVFYYLYRLRDEGWLLQIALCFITAGAIGNLYDRFFRGKVVDLFDFEFFDIFIPSFEFLGIHFSGYSMTRWPVFNVADMAVSGGMIILVAYLIFVGDPLNPPSKVPVENSDG
jgi:signal peptidase II